MRRALLALVISVAGLVTACSGPQAGESCDVNGFLCQDEKTALECRVGKWQALPCRGPTGCSTEGDIVNCDLTGALLNDACASSAEGRGVCTNDGKGTLECQQGKFVQTNTCTSCAVSGDQVTCTP